MTKTITIEDIQRIIREEIQRALEEDIDTQVRLGNSGDVDGVSPGLRVREDESGLLYTVTKVADDTIVLQSADSGETFEVSRQELENQYRLD